MGRAAGRLVRSADLLALGPVVIKFVRGRWCPYCTTELEVWRDLHPRLREAGALMIAVSPQTARQADFMAGQHSLPFPLLADPGCSLAAQFGLAFTVPDYLRDYYRSILVNIPFVNGDQSWLLPLPATYVLGQDSKVLFAEAHADVRVRPEPEEALAAAIAARWVKAGTWVTVRDTCRRAAAMMSGGAVSQPMRDSSSSTSRIAAVSR